ncbi:MAG: hypothetical protein ABIZ56_04645 [Chthoniobacteraceae bacterium]
MSANQQGVASGNKFGEYVAQNFLKARPSALPPAVSPGVEFSRTHLAKDSL